MSDTLLPVPLKPRLLSRLDFFKLAGATVAGTLLADTLAPRRAEAYAAGSFDHVLIDESGSANPLLDCKVSDGSSLAKIASNGALQINSVGWDGSTDGSYNHNSFDSIATPVDQSQWDRAYLAIGSDLTKHGQAGTGGSADQAAATIQVDIGNLTGSPTPANYQKTGLLVIARTNHPSASDASITYDCVGIDTRGYINGTNTQGRAWGLYAEGNVLDGGDGLAYCAEFFLQNTGSDQSAVADSKSKYGLHIFAAPPGDHQTGTGHNGTAAIFIDSAAQIYSIHWHRGLYMDSDSLVLPSTGVPAGTFLELSSQFVVTTGGAVGMGTTSIPFNGTVPATQAWIKAAGAGTTGLVLQTAASPTADLLQCQNASGSILANISPTGAIGVRAAVGVNAAGLYLPAQDSDTAPTLVVGSSTSSKAAISSSGSGVKAQSTTGTPLIGVISDILTNNSPNVLMIQHATSNPSSIANGFGGAIRFQAYTQAGATMTSIGQIAAVWANPTTALGRMVFKVSDSVNDKEGLRIEADGSTDTTKPALLGFFGAAAVAKPSVTGSRTGNSDVVLSLLSALSSLGLVTNNTTT